MVEKMNKDGGSIAAKDEEPEAGDDEKEASVSMRKNGHQPIAIAITIITITIIAMNIVAMTIATINIAMTIATINIAMTIAIPPWSHPCIHPSIHLSSHPSVAICTQVVGPVPPSSPVVEPWLQILEPS
eukprot:10225158-Lingulodinium_polyedra.AAC.1